MSDAARLRAMITERLDPFDSFRPAAPARRSDFDLNPDWSAPRGAVLREAAVLIPLVERAEGLGVLLTRRADHLKQHAGQIAFPGGRLEPGETPWVAALREAQEEVALDPAFVELAGLSTAYETGTGFHVTPVVGFLKPGFTVHPDDAEVADVFEAPFDFLMDAANHQRRFYDFPDGRRRWFYAVDWNDRLIWGATAGMLRALWERLQDEAA